MNIQNSMFEEMASKELFELAKKSAYEYQEGITERNVYPSQEAIDNLKFFDEDLPATNTSPQSIIRLLAQYGSPATVAQTGGRYFGFVCGGVVPVALAAKWLTDFWDQNTGMQVMSPVSSKLEVIVEKWLNQLFNLPANTAAGFVSGTFVATFCALAAARYRILQRKAWDMNERGLYQSPPIRIITSKQAHTSVIKAISLLGLGKENIEWVNVDAQGRIIISEIPQPDENTIIILQAGNVNSGCFEDFNAICELAHKYNSWVHIDGAFGLWAKASYPLAHLASGIEKADSWAVDGHKTLNTPYDCGIVLCKDRDALVSALHTTGSYIVEGSERDGMFYTIDMSRRARIVELWAVMKYLGRDGISELVTQLHTRAVQFAEELKAQGFEIMNDVVFNQVLAHYKSDEDTLAVLNSIQQQRVCWCGPSEWNGKKVIRISVCSWATTEEDVTKSVGSFVSALRKVTERNTVF